MFVQFLSNHEFYVNDPKRRHVHKAFVKDRIIHHLLYKYLYALFDPIFIYDSYSCRINKGTRKAVKRLEYFARKASKNYTNSCLALKCDVKKFFASVDHQTLLNLLRTKIKEEDIVWLLNNVISSFEVETRKGIPLGNLTSQIFANIYMNEFDQFIKHELKIKYYIRYADDLLILDSNVSTLCQNVSTFKQFLAKQLKLDLHPDKIIIRKLSCGFDFCGYIVLPHYTLPRTKTKRRMFKKIREKIGSEGFNQTLASYFGYLSHANTYKLREKLIQGLLK